MSDTYMAWDGKHYPSPPPEGWHQASDGRWWAPGTGPKKLPSKDPTATTGTESIDDADGSQTILPGDDVAIPAINRDPKRAGTWPSSSESSSESLTEAASEPATESPLVRSDRRMTRAEFEATKTQGGAATSPVSRPPMVSDSDQSIKPEELDPTAQIESQTTILPNDLTAPATPKPTTKELPPNKPGPQPASLENSTNAKGEPFIPAPPNPNARPLPVVKDEKSSIAPIIGGVIAALLIGGAALWFFVLRDTDNTETATSESSTTTNTTSTTTADEETADEPSTADSEEALTVEPSVTTSSTATTADVTTTASSTSETTPTNDAEGVTPTSATIPRAEVVSEFRASLASNGLNSSTLTDDDIVKFGEDFCFIASSSQDRSSYDTEAQAAIDDSSSQLTDDELRLIIDTAVVVSCPDQAKRLEVTV